MEKNDHPSDLIIPIGIVWTIGLTIWLLSQVLVLKLIYPIIGNQEYVSNAVPIFEYLHTDSTPHLTLRENKHMLDVKQLLSKTEMMTTFLSGLLIFWIATTREALNRNYLKKLCRRTTMSYLITMLIIVSVGTVFWNHFFVLFHEVLFPPDTWSFPANSTLITLFPEVFWQKIALLTVLSPLLLLILAWKISHNN